jgi:rhodanese-related sulfurtransferase
MRDSDEYKKWHIRDALNYYHILLNQDKFIPELYRIVKTIVSTNMFYRKVNLIR